MNPPEYFLAEILGTVKQVPMYLLSLKKKKKKKNQVKMASDAVVSPNLTRDSDKPVVGGPYILSDWVVSVKTSSGL